MEFDIKKYGNSYTTMLVGVNESGKSNILQALSFFKTPSGECDFDDYCTQKEEDKAKYVLCSYELAFENKEDYRTVIDKKIVGDKKLSFEISRIEKNVYLGKGNSKFAELYEIQVCKLPENKFIKVIEPNKSYAVIDVEEAGAEVLNEESLLKYFQQDIEAIIKLHEPEMSFWKSSEDYLIASDIDLNTFKDNQSNRPLVNIFALAGSDTKAKILDRINNITNSRHRSRLQKILSEKATEYIQNIWKHNIEIIIEIDKTSNCAVHIRDDGEANSHDRYSMNARSDGFKQFISLILSLSVETTQFNKNNRLIIIDEPEMHLHPSAIRDLSKELIRMGEKNYVFVATHSPFLIDKKHKERNMIISKNNHAITEKKAIKAHESIIDDEVLREAFGLEVYKDLLNPHSILVEGATDKVILEKAFKVKGITDYGITNGHGSSIVTLACKLNDTGISIVVVVDDDEAGKDDKEKIQKIGKFYKDNVFTIRDLVGDIIAGGTIEDTLGKEFVESQFNTFYKSLYNKAPPNSLKDNKPFIAQITAQLKKHDSDLKDSNKLKECLNLFKKEIAKNVPSSNPDLEENFPHLNSLVEKIKEKLEETN